MNARFDRAASIFDLKMKNFDEVTVTVVQMTGGLVPRLLTQPFRAGLTFGVRASGSGLWR
jgi:hypothetical protein